jgi:hypothetical protein
MGSFRKDAAKEGLNGMRWKYLLYWTAIGVLFFGLLTRIDNRLMHIEQELSDHDGK